MYSHLYYYLLLSSLVIQHLVRAHVVPTVIYCALIVTFMLFFALHLLSLLRNCPVLARAGVALALYRTATMFTCRWVNFLLGKVEYVSAIIHT